MLLIEQPMPTQRTKEGIRRHEQQGQARIQGNTAAKEGRIKAGIKADPDARELTTKDFAEMVPFAEKMKRRRGRPKAPRTRCP